MENKKQAILQKKIDALVKNNIKKKFKVVQDRWHDLLIKYYLKFSISNYMVLFMYELSNQKK